jgi:hypothetical protein
MKTMRRALSVLLAAATAVTLLTTAGLAAGFSDTEHHWAKKYIDEGVKAGYISGYTDGTFRPDGSVTRGAFCKILNKALGLEATADITFQDVKSTDTFYTEIRRAVYAGYISGYTDNTFRAGSTITRQEAAVMLSRIVTPPKSPKSLSTLKDGGSISAYAKSGVQTMISKGYLAGDAGGRFNPSAVLTRGQTAKIISTLRGGERIVHGAVEFTTSGKTYSDDIYVGPLTVSIPANGTLTFDNCRLLGLLTVKTGASVKLADTDVVALSVNASAVPTVTADGASSVKHVYLASAANLTESNLTGAGFADVQASGSAMKSGTTTLRGAFASVTASSPMLLTLASGSVAKLQVASGAAGSVFALSAGTNVASAVLNGACAFTGSGTITAAQQNVDGVTYQNAPATVTGSGAKTALTMTVSPSNGASDVSVSVDPVLSFSENVYDAAYSGTRTPGSSTLGKAFQLYRGSVSSSRLVDASVGISGRKLTLTPSESLEASTTYYLVVGAGYLKNAAGTVNTAQQTSFTTASAGTLVPTVSPKDGATGVSLSVDPTFTFSENVYDAAYSSDRTPGTSVLNKTFQLYRGSISSSRLVDASVSISGRTVTLTPDETLLADTTYYLVVNEGYLKNSSDKTNPYRKFSFTTTSKGTLVPSVSPKDGATGVSVSVDPTFTFSESVYDAAYSSDRTPGTSVLNKTFQLYRGSISSSRLVDASVSISGRVVTLEPDSDLNTDTTYYLVVNEGYLKNSDGKTNSYQKTSFTTSASGNLTPSVSPSDGASGVSVSVNPTFSFGTAIYDAAYSGSRTPSTSTLGRTFQLYRGSASSGSRVSCSVSISSSNRVVTLDPDSDLSLGTTYYLVMNDGYVKNGSGDTNAYRKYSFTTTAGNTLSASFSPSSGATGVSAAAAPAVTFSEAVYDATRSGYYTPSTTLGNAVQLYKGQRHRRQSRQLQRKPRQLLPDRDPDPRRRAEQFHRVLPGSQQRIFQELRRVRQRRPADRLYHRGAQGHRHEHRRLRGGLHLRGGELYLHRCGQQCHGHPGDSGPDPERDGGRQHHRRLHRAGARRQLRRHHLRARGRRDLQGLQRPGLHQDPHPQCDSHPQHRLRRRLHRHGLCRRHHDGGVRRRRRQRHGADLRGGRQQPAL